MALREEFEYLSFRCCYCMTYNPSRKLRPSAPKLEDDTPLIRRRLSMGNKSSSESEKISDQSDSEPEQSDKDDKKQKIINDNNSSHENSDNENNAQDDLFKDEKSIVDPTIDTIDNNVNNDTNTEKDKDI